MINTTILTTDIASIDTTMTIMTITIERDIVPNDMTIITDITMTINMGILAETSIGTMTIMTTITMTTTIRSGNLNTTTITPIHTKNMIHHTKRNDIANLNPFPNIVITGQSG